MRRLGSLILLASTALGACQPGGSSTIAPPAQTTSTPSAAATTAATPASTPAATLPVALQRPTDLPTDGSCEDQNSSCLGILKANTAYASKVFKPTLHFTLPVDGFINEYDGAGDIGFLRLDPAGDIIIFFRYPRADDETVGATVTDIASWIESNASLDATPFEPVKLGGLKGLTLDVTTVPGAPGVTGADCPVQVCVPVLRGDDPVPNDPYQWHWDWSLAGPEKMRLYLLDAPEDMIAVVIDSVDGSTFDSLIDVWEKVAPTVKFG